MTQSSNFETGRQVKHKDLGSGTVEHDPGNGTVLVRFEANNIESVLANHLEYVESWLDFADEPLWLEPIRVINKIQAASIRSINDMWGIFSQSLITLYPHQLWVCRKVNDTWPARWLVADDVGLGKTIEAGLILQPLIASGKVKRLLVLCPASLVSQWSARMKNMFDIRLSEHMTELDTDKRDYFGQYHQVVASLQTMRAKNGRRERLIASDMWDMVIVDEAHHLNRDEKSGSTLGYDLIETLVSENKVKSLVMFTGTPHRGKDYNFWSLMELVNPNLFGADLTNEQRLDNLPKGMIRNNKQNVTDLLGNKVFKGANIREISYVYSQEETVFYDKLTDFIATGKAYANTLNTEDQRLVMLIIICMQKIASSSISAIRRSLKNRLDNIKLRKSSDNPLELVPKITETVNNFVEAEYHSDLDQVGLMDQSIVDESSGIDLMDDEITWLEELISAAEAIDFETKIEKILLTVDQEFSTESILFFTEYKATQSLLMSKLMQRYGETSVTFINGDEEALEIFPTDYSTAKTIRTKRDLAADSFNSGQVRFMVSTEAAGEGIDLQSNCHVLVHVDLPWNPMRLHQRVGRLNRIGQKFPVDVMIFKNTQTVESHIWGLLEEKLESIARTVGAGMDDPEDIKELVLGMVSPYMRELFAEADPDLDSAGLKEWFDDRTASFDGEDSLNTVKELGLRAEKFDYQNVAPDIPNLTLEDLKPFLCSRILDVHRRRITSKSGYISFKTPDAWTSAPYLRSSYDDMHFNREISDGSGVEKILGVGHKIVDLALTEAKNDECQVSSLFSVYLEDPMVVFQIQDEQTVTSGSVREKIIGVSMPIAESGTAHVLTDDDLLKLSNDWYQNVPKSTIISESKRPVSAADIAVVVYRAQQFLQEQSIIRDLPFEIPRITLFCVLWPDVNG